MELDNIIYITIIIAIFVFSLLSQIKKKKVEKGAMPEEKEYSLNDFEKILQRKEEFKILEKPAETFKNERYNDTEEIETPPENKELKNLSEEKENIDGFDIKSAVVYSSILERKKLRR